MLSHKDATTLLKKATLPFNVKKLVSIGEPSDQGNTDRVYELTLETNKNEQKKLFVKEAATIDRRGLVKDLDPNRIRVEAWTLQTLNKHGHTETPEVHYFDEDNCRLLLEDVSVDAELLAFTFERNEVAKNAAKPLAQFLGNMHGRTFGTQSKHCEPFEDMPDLPGWRKMVAEWLFQDRWGVAARKNYSEETVQRFYKILEEAPQALVWLDPLHRNIFVQEDGTARVIDFPFSMTHDPATDVGILTAHWEWMALHEDKEVTKKSKQFLNDFHTEYNQVLSEYDVSKQDQDELHKRADMVAGYYLLSRVDGRKNYFEDTPDWADRILARGKELFDTVSTYSSPHS